MSRLLTWLDADRAIRQRTLNGAAFPPPIENVVCYADGLEVAIGLNSSASAVTPILEEWFGAAYLKDRNIIELEIPGSSLPIEIVKTNEPRQQKIFRPLWQDLGNLPVEPFDGLLSFLPEPTTVHPQIASAAYHSFKGGVGRTTALLTYVKAVVDASVEKKAPSRILIIDGDLEAPGLTFLLSPIQKPTVSLINLLEAAQLSALPRRNVIEFFSKELSKFPVRYGTCEIFVLPSFLEESQLLDLRVKPEHLAKQPDDPWSYSDLMFELATKLEAEFLFVDLRAGLSEISGPVLFDPRFERFLVSTVAEQSVKGTAFVLRHLAASTRAAHWSRRFDAPDPQILVSMLIPELRSSDAYTSLLTSFEEAYTAAESDTAGPLDSLLSFTDIALDTNLLTLKSLDEALGDRLRHSSLYVPASSWAYEHVGPVGVWESATRANADLGAEVEQLRITCSRFEYAEQGLGEDLLITDPLRNLAQRFVDTLPAVISIGAKGSGKTFTYIQLCRLQTWSQFLKKANPLSKEPTFDADIFPVLQSSNLETAARRLVEDARRSAEADPAQGGTRFSPITLKDQIEDLLVKNPSWSKAEWSQFWIEALADATGHQGIKSVEALCDLLRHLHRRVVFLFDGIEETFASIDENEPQRRALSALVELPNRFEEIRQSPAGVIVFLREDYVKAIVTQNRGQFERRYEPFKLLWDADSFLRLAYWICAEAGVIGADRRQVASLTREQLLDRLNQLWGRKLGPPKSREAYSANWIYGALTDLKGRLQARDIVRFLRFAAEASMTAHIGSPAEWTDRLLSPRAIRNALEPCSESKVKEAITEYALFGKWVQEVSQKHPTLKRIPFDPARLGIAPETLEMLKEIGVVFEDRDTEDPARFYIPEIYRTGLGFSLDKGARPRVLVLQKKALGQNLI